MNKQLIKLFRCKGCNKIRKHGTWIYMTDFQKELMLKYYNVYFHSVVCENCRQHILDGTPL